MKRIVLLALIALYCANPAAAQLPLSTDSVGTSPDFLFNRIELRHGRNLKKGVLLGAGQDSVFILSIGEKYGTRLEELSSIKVSVPSRTLGRVIEIGTVLGYATALPVFQPYEGKIGEIEPNASIGDIALGTAGIILPYALLAWLFDGTLNPDEKEFHFQRGESGKAQREEFVHLISGKKSGKKFHITASSGSINGGLSQSIESHLQANGFLNTYPWPYYYNSPSSTVTLMRNITATYSITENSEIGLTHYPLSSTSIWGNEGSGINRISLRLEGSTSLTALIWKQEVPWPIPFKIGFLAGYAPVELNVDASRNYKSETFIYDQTRFSAGLRVETGVQLTKYLSLGAYYDKLYMGTIDVPSMQDDAIPASQLPVGSSSFGVTFGLHY